VGADHRTYRLCYVLPADSVCQDRVPYGRPWGRPRLHRGPSAFLRHRRRRHAGVGSWRLSAKGLRPRKPISTSARLRSGSKPCLDRHRPAVCFTALHYDSRCGGSGDMPKSRGRKRKPRGTLLKLSPGAMDVLHRQRERFREKFRRDPGPNDPVFLTQMPLNRLGYPVWT
jgi:hypothetical protein